MSAPVSDDTNTVSDPTHAESEPSRYWTSANIGEATPDVLSPMCWSFWGPMGEAAARRAYHRFGILGRRDLAVPSDVNQLMTGYFYGRPALNVDLLRPLFGSLPGVSADDFERDLCGKVRPGQPDASRRSRLPVIVVKGVLAMRSTPRDQAALSPRMRAWWERDVRDARGGTDPLASLRDAAARYGEAFEIHCRGRFVLMASQAALAKLADSAGRPDLLLGVLAGLGGVTEVQLADDLWQVSRGQLDMDVFVGRHGFHGPNEGNLFTRSWREDPSPLLDLVASLSKRPDSQRPASREAAGGTARVEALDALVAALPKRRRAKARKAAAALVDSTRANELSKAAFLMALDGGRAAARRAGRALVDAGTLDEVDDVFFLTIDELGPLLAGSARSDTRELVRVRRARRERHRQLLLPVTFSGTPQPTVGAAGEAADRDGATAAPGSERDADRVTGAAGSPGTVTGRARVVLDPNDAAPLDPGEVLVCRFTDPSWTPMFLLADALVIDIGGPASHGAIVARELGVPCVIGTGNGTQRIVTGDLISVDGSAGTVTVIERADGALR
jgi:phosphohistidine swiveling domain-containing protein